MDSWVDTRRQRSHRHAVFTHGHEELQVFTANKQPLDSETQRSIVTVQYKMMERQARAARKTSSETILQDTRKRNGSSQ